MQHLERPRTAAEVMKVGGNADAAHDEADRTPGSDPAWCAVAACEQYIAENNLDAARSKVSSFEMIAPLNEQEWQRLRMLCLALSDRTRAQVYTERFLQVCPGNPEAHLANARNFASANRDRDRILEAVNAALKNPRSDAEFWREVATIQSDIREYAAACSSARKSIALDPDNVEMRELLISCLGHEKQRTEIRRECVQLAACLSRSADEDPLRWARLARIAAEAGAGTPAKSYIDKATNCLSKVNYGAEFELIRALILTRQAKRAMLHLQHFLEDNTRNTWVWTTLLEMAMLRRYYDIALVVIHRLKAIPYQDPEFLYRLSLTERTAATSGTGHFGAIARRLRYFITRG